MIKLRITTEGGQSTTLENVGKYTIEVSDDEYIDNTDKFETVRKAIDSTSIPVTNEDE